MLHGTTATAAEMCARRVNAPLPGFQPFDNPALASTASSGTEVGADAVARHREGQKDRFAVAFGNAVALRAEPFDRKLHEPVCPSLIPVERPRHHKQSKHIERRPCRTMVLLLPSPQEPGAGEANHDRMLHL
jgi:hypothetical protein